MSLAALDAYRRALSAGGGSVREPDAAFADAGELALQARWFAGEFGRDWLTVDGKPARIEDFGRWNHESGPDFIDARIRLGRAERRGSIELDLDARDWERHGHATNPAFRETVAHVFVHRPAQQFFTRTCDHREVPQIHLAPGAHTPAFAPPSHEPITLDGTNAMALVEAAARHRLDLKAAALRRSAAVRGEDEAWFAALAVALGYKRNQTPLLLLAQRIGLGAAARPAGESLLFGVAGFMDFPEPPASDHDARAYLRRLWEGWWAERARRERWILNCRAWRFAGSRPANHPHRRVATLAAIASGWKPIRAALAGSQRAGFVAALEALDHPFWATRFSLQSARLARPQALLGDERIRDILLNIHYPLAVERDDSAWSGFLLEHGPTPAAIMRSAAGRFFGGALGRALQLAVTQQGLLQIQRDHLAAAEPQAFLAALRAIPFPPASECSTPLPPDR
ncbi:MAG: DUF2851 family protein [Terrimicrobiaceae bacterium]|nr:DUF2851 family protein [Terrimicrobiaceae bacterium]